MGEKHQGQMLLLLIFTKFNNPYNSWPIQNLQDPTFSCQEIVFDKNHVHVNSYVYYPAAAHAQSGVKQSVLFVCLSVVKKILKSVLCAQYTALKNIGIREKRIYFPSWAPVSSTWLFLGSSGGSRGVSEVSTETPFCCDFIIAHILRIRAADLLLISCVRCARR